MSVLSWNCRGIENYRTVQDLCQMVKEKRPGVVFLMETKLRSNKSTYLKHKLRFEHMFVVDCKGRNGGLILLW
jgi:exonuclease III